MTVIRPRHSGTQDPNDLAFIESRVLSRIVAAEAAPFGGTGFI